MATNKTVFELNGQAYDALTGALLGPAKRVEHTVNVQAMQPKAMPQHHGSVDGMVAASHRKAAHGKSAAKHVAAHKPQPTKTLMRRAVKQPAVTAASAKQGSLQTQSPLHASVPAHLAVKPKLSSDMVDPMRARRAKVASRSQAVQHFKPAAVAPAKTFGAIGAAPAAVQPQAQPGVPAIHPPAALRNRQARPVQDFRRPSAAALAASSRRAQTAQIQTVRQPAATYARSAATAQAVRQDETAYEQDLFEQALAHATSHEQRAPHESALSSLKRKSRKRRQILGIAASLTVFVLLFGFIAYQNRADIQLQLASARAGFSASMPLYKPDGYKMEKLKYAPGTVSALFHRQGGQSFTVTQKKSNWDSQTLLENFVVNSKEDYQGFQSNGRTVYVYGKGNATWVNGGIWYQLKDNSGLSSEQLVKIAASM